MKPERDFFPVMPMAPDLGLYAGSDEASDLCKGFVPFSGQPMLVWKHRALPDSPNAALATAVFNGISSGFDRLFLATDAPEIHDWNANAVSSATTDRTPAVAAHMEDLPYTFDRWGKTFIASPHNVGVAAELLQYDPGAGTTFERFVTSADKPVGKYTGRIRNHFLVLNADEPTLGPEANRGHFSARLDIRDWSDSSKYAGIFYIQDRKVGNDIIGFQPWEDFGGVWTIGGVYRLSFVGGTERFELDSIGEGHETLFGPPVVAVGRDGFYVSNTGPRVIINGERTQSLGAFKITRSLMDRSYGASWALESLLGGGYDRLHSAVWWAYTAPDGVWWVLGYELESGEFFNVELGDPAPNFWSKVGVVDDAYLPTAASITEKYDPVDLETVALADHGKPLWNLIIIPSKTGGDWQAWGQILKLPAGTLRRDVHGIEYLSKVKRIGNGPAMVHGVRALWEANSTMLSSGVVLTAQLETSEDRHFRAANVRTHPLTSDNEDSRGFMRNGMPAKGLYWRVRASLPEQQQVLLSGASLSSHYQVKCLTAFEVEWTAAGRSI